MEEKFEENEYLLSLIDESIALFEDDPSFEERDKYSYHLEKKPENKKTHDNIKFQEKRLIKEEEECYECPLYKNRFIYAFPIETVNPSALFVLPSPSGNSMLGNDALQMWKKWVDLLGLSLNQVGLTSLLKCPADNSFDYQYADICKHFLRDELVKLQPKSIILLGESLSQYMLRNQSSFDSLRGKSYKINRIPTYVTYNPEILVRSPNLKKPAWEDIQFIRDNLKNTGICTTQKS